MAELRSLSKARDIRGRKGRSALIRSDFQQKLIGDIKKIVANFSSGPGSTKGVKNIADAFTRLKQLAESRNFNTKLVDKNLEVSMRLLRAKEVGNVRQRLLPGADARIENTLGKFEESTLELMKAGRLNRARKDIARLKLRKILGNEIFDKTVESETPSVEVIRKGLLKAARVEFRK